MNKVNNRYLPGLDLLKFILAVLIISAHTLLFKEYPSFHNWWRSLTAIAVPIFFGISSYLFFRKIFAEQDKSLTRQILIHTIKRLAILFIFWYLLMIPMTYFRFYSVATFKETVYALLFSCCFNGYWFIKALFINTTILYFFRKKNSLFICSFIALTIYLYCAYNYIYHYNPLLESLHPYYSFYYHTAYFSIGALFARFQDRLHFERWRIYILISIWFIILLLTNYRFFSPLYRISSFLFIFPIFYQMDARIPTNTFKYLRNMSIILYMVQFVLIWIYNGICNMWIKSNITAYHIMQFSIISFIIITLVAITLAWLILTLEKKPHLSFLRYLH